MLEIGSFIYFIPPLFGSGLENKKMFKRLMRIIAINNDRLTLVNISKVLNKPNCLTYPFNILIRNYNPPLPLLSFAKVNDIYVIDYFDELKCFIYKNGDKLNKYEVDNIINKYNQYKSNNNIECVYLIKDDI